MSVGFIAFAGTGKLEPKEIIWNPDEGYLYIYIENHDSALAGQSGTISYNATQVATFTMPNVGEHTIVQIQLPIGLSAGENELIVECSGRSLTVKVFVVTIDTYNGFVYFKEENGLDNTGKITVYHKKGYVWTDIASSIRIPNEYTNMILEFYKPLENGTIQYFLSELSDIITDKTQSVNITPQKGKEFHITLEIPYTNAKALAKLTPGGEIIDYTEAQLGKRYAVPYIVPRVQSLVNGFINYPLYAYEYDEQHDTIKMTYKVTAGLIDELLFALIVIIIVFGAQIRELISSLSFKMRAHAEAEQARATAIQRTLDVHTALAQQIVNDESLSTEDKIKYLDTINATTHSILTDLKGQAPPTQPTKEENLITKLAPIIIILAILAMILK